MNTCIHTSTHVHAFIICSGLSEVWGLIVLTTEYMSVKKQLFPQICFLYETISRTVKGKETGTAANCLAQGHTLSGWLVFPFIARQLICPLHSKASTPGIVGRKISKVVKGRVWKLNSFFGVFMNEHHLFLLLFFVKEKLEVE